MNNAELRKLAEAATPGPWHAHVSRPGAGGSMCYREAVIGRCMPDGLSFRVALSGDQKWPQWPKDADFIAAANPQTIISLLDRLDALEKVAEAAGMVHQLDTCADDDDILRAHDALAVALSALPSSERSTRKGGGM